MDAIERAANLSVGRACGFAGLAILCGMVGYSYDPNLSARVGGGFALLWALVLIWKAKFAHRRPYQHTETWLMLADGDRPRDVDAARMINAVLHRTYLIYAKYSAILAAMLLSSSFVFDLILR